MFCLVAVRPSEVESLHRLADQGRTIREPSDIRGHEMRFADGRAEAGARSVAQPLPHPVRVSDYRQAGAEGLKVGAGWVVLDVAAHEHVERARDLDEIWIWHGI